MPPYINTLFCSIEIYGTVFCCGELVNGMFISEKWHVSDKVATELSFHHGHGQRAMEAVIGPASRVSHVT